MNGVNGATGGLDQAAAAGGAEQAAFDEAMSTGMTQVGAFIMNFIGADLVQTIMKGLESVDG